MQDEDHNDESDASDDSGVFCLNSPNPKID
jgi:hypothetical protein